MQMLDTLVVVTEDNFNEKDYLFTNGDVAKAGVDPWKHFQNYGRKERRLQVNTSLFPDSPAWQQYRREKFNRFKPLLLLDNEPDNGSFPVYTGGVKAADFTGQAGNLGNTGYGPFNDEIERNPDKLYLELGSGLRCRVYSNCLTLEIHPFLTTDLIVAPNCTYPIRDNSLDGIGSFAVLEHVRKPWKVVEEMRRMLKPGGKVWIDWPFLQPGHGFPSHYFNATREGLRSIFEDNGFGIEDIQTMITQAPDAAITWILNGFLHRLPLAKRKRVLKMRVGELLKNPPENAFWRDLLNLVDDDTLSTFASGNTLVARKLK